MNGRDAPDTPPRRGGRDLGLRRVHLPERFWARFGKSGHLQRQFTGDPGLIVAGAIVPAPPVVALCQVLKWYLVQSVASPGTKG